MHIQKTLVVELAPLTLSFGARGDPSGRHLTLIVVDGLNFEPRKRRNEVNSNKARRGAMLGRLILETAIMLLSNIRCLPLLLFLAASLPININININTGTDIDIDIKHQPQRKQQQQQQQPSEVTAERANLIQFRTVTKLTLAEIVFIHIHRSFISIPIK